MTSRELVHAAFRHVEPDRTPIFEREIRKELGLVLTPEEAPRIAHHVAELLAAHGEHRARLERLRERCVYHFGESGEAGARVLGGILDGG